MSTASGKEERLRRHIFGAKLDKLRIVGINSAHLAPAEIVAVSFLADTDRLIPLAIAPVSFGARPLASSTTFMFPRAERLLLHALLLSQLL
jgi:hypothetical protein